MSTVPSSFNERQVRSVLRKVITQRGHLKCPRCGSFAVLRSERRYFCCACRKKFSLTSYTWLKHAKLSLAIVARILDCWISEYPITTTVRETGVSVPTVRRYFQLFRIHIVQTLDFKAKGHVQVDEAYFGTFRKRGNSYHGMRTYVVQNKVGVFGIACPTTGKLKTVVIGKKPGTFIRDFIHRSLSKDITIFSDKSPYYTKLRKEGFRHHAQTHEQGFHTSYFIESCWSWMKRKLFKQYHHCTKRYATDYIAELTWRFNIREQARNPLDFLLQSLQPVPHS